MQQAKWIWYPGDFEMYHHLLLSCRRQEHGCDYPCVWHLSSPEKSVRFYKDFTVDNDTVIHIHTHSAGMVRLAGKFWQVNADIPLKPGNYGISVELYDIEKFPSFFVQNEFLNSDESWYCECFDRVEKRVACEPIYDKADDDPSVFRFCYENIEPIKKESINGGVLYDFGKETFAVVTVKHKELSGIRLAYGESRGEALDFENAIIREELTETDSGIRPARAFRYIFVDAPGRQKIDITAAYEYLPLEDKAEFRCDNPLIEDIWKTCVYTFHLNSREFFLDGIKRDRWVWSGDAYQSFMINRCLYNDNGLTERTIIALLGKPPYRCHINTINDYSAYLIFAVWEHWFHSGNKRFLENVFPNVKELYNFIISRLDNRGYVVPVNCDWIFIDWGELDKTGANCFEQILLWNVYTVMGKLSLAMGEEDIYSQNAEVLKSHILRDFWREKYGAFIDSFDSGREFVSRQTNVMAVLLDFVNDKQEKSIIKNVFENDDLPQIKTPYFKLYELLALCKCGKIAETQRYIESYWGGMLKLGATSIWEEFNPEKRGDEHYEMYSAPYGKSLCHAWGAGPVLLLISQIAGIKITGFQASRFTVEPHPGLYGHFTAKAPVGNGFVKVTYSEKELCVFADVAGGTLVYDNRSYPIPVNEILVIAK